MNALLRESEEKNNLSISLKGILNASTNGIIVFESIRNQHKQVVDFKSTMYNAAAEEMLSLNNRKPFFSEIFNDKHEILFPKFVSLLDSDRPISFEMYYETLNKWFLTSAVRMKDGFTQTL